MIGLATALAQAQLPPTEDLPTPNVEFVGIGPEVAVAGAALVIVALLSLAHRWPVLRRSTLGIGIVGLLTGGFFAVQAWDEVTDVGGYETLAGMVAVDGFAVFLKVVVLGATLVGLLLADGYLRRENLDAGAYHALILLSASGMLMMASANDLIVVFLALEVLSIALYVLAAFHRQRVESEEAGLKYFVLGAFSSAVFLYGVAFVYGATGTTSLTGIAQFLAETALTQNVGLLIGIALLVVGLGFKVSAVPFHMWTPDVYQGAPTPVTAFMASGTKVAAFGALLRVLVAALESYQLDWQPIVWVLAALTMVVGSVLAIVQSDVKRMMAYSSISHAGFILIGVQVASDEGVSAVLSYLLAYTFIVLGTFTVVTLMSRRGDVGHDLDDYRGLSTRRPVLAALFTVLLLAQAGIPLTSGFVAKLTVFRAAVDGEQYGLVILGVLVSVVAAFVYLRVLVASYMSSAEGDGETAAVGGGLRVDLGSGIALGVAVAVTLAMGILPNVFLDFADRATLLF